MSVKPTEKSNVSWAQWATIAAEVRDTRQAALVKGVTTPGPVEAASASGVTEAPRTGLGDRLVQLLNRHPVLLQASESERNAALQAALSKDTLLAPLTALADGLSRMASLDAPHPQLAYSQAATLLRQVRDLRGAIQSAGGAVPTFPKAQLDTLEEELRRALRGLVQEFGGAVRNTEAGPLDKVLAPQARALLESFREVLGTLRGAELDPTLAEAALMRFDAGNASHYLRQIAYQWAAPFLPNQAQALEADLTARSLESGRRLDAAAVVDVLFQHATTSTAKDVLHAFLGARFPELAPSRSVPPFEVSTGLTPMAQNVWALIPRGGPLEALRNEAQKAGDFDEMLRARQGRSLDPDTLVEFLAARANRNGPAAIALNHLCVHLRMEPIAGLPPELRAQRQALIELSGTVSKAVADTNAKVTELTNRAAGELKPLSNELDTLLREVAKGGDLSTKIEKSRTLLNQGEAITARYLQQFSTLEGQVAETYRKLGDDLRKQSFAFRVEIATVRARTEVTDPNLASAISSVEHGLNRRLREVEAGVEGGLRASPVASGVQQLRQLQTSLESQCLTLFSAFARHAARAEQQAQAEQAAKEAEAARAQLASVPLDIERLRTASEPELAAYGLPGNAHSVVIRLRRAGLSEELFAKVAAETFELRRGNQLALKDDISPFSRTIWGCLNLIERVGSGLSYQGAAEAIRSQTDRMVSDQRTALERSQLRAYLTELVEALTAQAG